jgi:hypothetical protein
MVSHTQQKSFEGHLYKKNNAKTEIWCHGRIICKRSFNSNHRHQRHHGHLSIKTITNITVMKAIIDTTDYTVIKTIKDTTSTICSAPRLFWKRQTSAPLGLLLQYSHHSFGSPACGKEMPLTPEYLNQRRLVSAWRRPRAARSVRRDP